MTVKYIKSRQDIDTKYIYFIYRHTRTHTRSVRMCVRVSVMCWRRIKWKTKSHNHEHVNKLFNANGKVASFWCVWISLCLSACVFYCGRVFYMTAFLFENEKKNKKYDFIIGVDDSLLAHIFGVCCVGISLVVISAYILYTWDLCKSEGYLCLRVSAVVVFCLFERVF